MNMFKKEIGFHVISELIMLKYIYERRAIFRRNRETFFSN